MANIDTIIQNTYDYELHYTGKYINDFLGINAIDTVDYYDDLYDPNKVSDGRIDPGKDGTNLANSDSKSPSKIFYVVKDTVDKDGKIDESKLHGFYRFTGTWKPESYTDGIFKLHRTWEYIEELSNGGKVFTGEHLSPVTVGKIVPGQDIGNKNAKEIFNLMFSDLILTVPKFTTSFSLSLSNFSTKMYIGKSSSFGGNFTIGSYTNGSYGDNLITSTITNLQISLSETVNKPFTFTSITISFTPNDTSTEKQDVPTTAYLASSTSEKPTSTEYTPNSSDFGKNISFILSGSLTYTNPQTNTSVTETISSTITSTVYQSYYYGYSESSTNTEIDSWTDSVESYSSSAFSILTTTAISEFIDPSNPDKYLNKHLMVAIPGTMGGNDSMTLNMTPTTGGQPAQLQYVNSTELNSDTYFIYCSGSANASWAAYKITK